jgi:very-short-patch-repair endonuclease
VARWGIRPLATVFNKPPGKRAKQQRIHIPQPVERPFGIHGKDLVQWENLRPQEDDFTLHKRGIYRPKLEEDVRERRAVPHSERRGTLPERIVLKYVIEKLHMQEGYDFTFQTSMDGGRMEMGGIVADFVFEPLKLILNVQGSTHKEYLRGRKDEEQENILADMGYTLEAIWEDTIYNEYLFDDRMRSIFLKGESSGSGYQLGESESVPEEDQIELRNLVNELFVAVRAI